MTIGIDLRPLQNGHRFRGVGEVVKQVTNRVLYYGVADTARFIFYKYADADNPLELLELPDGLSYETVTVGRMPGNLKDTKGDKVARHLKELYGNPIDAHQCDVFLQYDYALGVPTGTRTVLVKHDLIPLVFWDQFFSSPMTHIRNKALRTTLRTAFNNYEFMRILRRSLKRADVIVANSAHTKKDVIRFFDVADKKIKVARLGVSLKLAKTHVKTNKKLPTKPYLLFVGGIDTGKRRAVDELVAAFNNLKADGRDIQLVLVGENFQEPKTIPNEAVKAAVMKSSYKKDIFTLGYIDDATKQKLYKEAIAFVYPTKYEGFGIPVLEGMLMECPVITYKNSSVAEVGGNYALYAHDWVTIKQQVEKLLSMKDTEKTQWVADAKKHAESFTWESTAKIVYEELVKQV
jgi:glycosyltransferase involved in cell wall biosynthesis